LGLRCVAIVTTLPVIGLAALSVSGPAAEHTSEMIPTRRRGTAKQSQNKLLKRYSRTAWAIKRSSSAWV
jgi:hypothetical protein